MRKNYRKKFLIQALLAAIGCFSLVLITHTQVQAKGFDNPAPDRKVTGTVTDDKGAPLAAVSVMLKGTKKGTTTDQNGVFSITVPDANAVLVLSFVGYATQEITVGEQALISVKMAQGAEQLSDVVVVGYGTQKKGNSYRICCYSKRF